MGTAYQNPELDFPVASSSKHRIISPNDRRCISLRYLPYPNPEFGNTKCLKGDGRVSDVCILVRRPFRNVFFSELSLGDWNVIRWPSGPTRGLHDAHWLNQFIVAVMAAAPTVAT